MNQSIKKIAQVMSSARDTRPTSNSKTQKKAPTDWRDRMSSQNYQLLRETFLIFDQDGSGQIDPLEIAKVLEEVGLDKRNQYVVHIIAAMRQANKKLVFEEFVEIVGNYTGDCKTKDGIRRIFNLYDKEGTGVVEFQQLKQMSREVGEHLTDDDLLDLMHAVFINQQTTSNESISFEEFYNVITAYYSKISHQREIQ